MKSTAKLWWFCLGGYFGVSFVISILDGVFARNGFDLGGAKLILAIGCFVLHYHFFKKFAANEKSDENN